MPTIYELSEEQSELLSALYWDEDDLEANARLNDIRGTVEQKLKFLSGLYAESKVEAELANEKLKIVSKQLKAQAVRAERAQDRLKQFIIDTMVNFDIKNVKGTECSLSWYYPAASMKVLDNFSLESVPKEFIKSIPATFEIDKGLLKAYLQDGHEVEGVVLVKTPALRMS